MLYFVVEQVEVEVPLPEGRHLPASESHPSHIRVRTTPARIRVTSESERHLLASESPSSQNDTCPRDDFRRPRRRDGAGQGHASRDSAGLPLVPAPCPRTLSPALVPGPCPRPLSPAFVPSLCPQPLSPVPADPCPSSLSRRPLSPPLVPRRSGGGHKIGVGGVRGGEDGGRGCGRGPCGRNGDTAQGVLETA